jgi:hypothetical protein
MPSWQGYGQLYLFHTVLITMVAEKSIYTQGFLIQSYYANDFSNAYGNYPYQTYFTYLLLLEVFVYTLKHINLG